MRIRERMSRLEARFPATPPGMASEGDVSIDPAEHERQLGYRLITPDMSASEAARHYLGAIRSTLLRPTPTAALPIGMTIEAAAEVYREQLG